MSRYIVLVCLFIMIAFIHFFGLLGYIIMSGCGFLVMCVYCWFKIRNSKRREEKEEEQVKDEFMC